MDSLKQQQLFSYINKLELLTSYKEYYYNKFNYVEVLKNDIIAYLNDLKTLTEYTDVKYLIIDTIYNLNTNSKYNHRVYLDDVLQTIFVKIHSHLINSIKDIIKE